MRTRIDREFVENVPLQVATLANLEAAIDYLSSLRHSLKTSLYKLQQSASKSELDLSQAIARCIEGVQLADDNILRLRNAQRIYVDIWQVAQDVIPGEVTSLDEQRFALWIRELPTGTVLVEEILQALYNRLCELRKCRIETRKTLRNQFRQQVKESSERDIVEQLKRAQKLQEQFEENNTIQPLLEANTILDVINVNGRTSDVKDLAGKLKSRQTGKLKRL